ncbi:MAG: hypothetical protein IJA32_06580 [Lachnospiraceae bacterium]|nr:hypothetical protein [Lachnospiraceae bacterium]
MAEPLKDIIKAIEKLEENLYQTTQIVFINSEDFLIGESVDLNDFPNNIFFICDPNVQKGTVIVLKDGPLKKEMYNFCREHPDRIIRGKKEVWRDVDTSSS